MRGIHRWFFRMITWAYACLFPPKKISSSDDLTPAPASIIVYSNTALGDTLLSTPAITKIRETFINARLSMIIHRRYLPLFQASSCVDHYILDSGGYRSFLSTLKAARRERPDLFVILHGNSPEDLQMAVLSGAKFILRASPETTEAHHLSFLLPKRHEHAILERLRVAEFLAGKKFDQEGDWRMWCAPLPLREGSEMLPRERRWIGFQLGASMSYKTWPPEYFAQLATILMDHFDDLGVVLLGVASEKKLAQKFLEALPLPLIPRVVDRCGHTRVEALPALLESLQLIISGDTGTMHLGVTLGVPTVALFGNTVGDLTGILYDRNLHTVIQKPEDGMSDSATKKRKRTNEPMKRITVEEVLEAAEKILHRSDSSKREVQAL